MGVRHVVESRSPRDLLTKSILRDDLFRLSVARQLPPIPRPVPCIRECHIVYSTACVVGKMR